MVRGLKSYVQNNSNILESLVKISGLTKAQVLDKLTFGKGPSINIVSNLKDKMVILCMGSSCIKILALYI